jgi:hypothetical protein
MQKGLDGGFKREEIKSMIERASKKSIEVREIIKGGVVYGQKD